MATIVIIGSGFGGAIAAKRFAEAGHTVKIIELGERWKKSDADPGPGATPQQSQDTKFLLRLFRDYPIDYLQSKPKLVITQGMGFGGGSLVYSGIHIRAPSSAFSTGWPSGYNRSNLDPFYARFESRIGAAALPDAGDYARSQKFAQGAAAAGLPAPQPHKLAMTGCTKCGWCVPICKWGKKNTMAHTYLQDAINTGRVTLYTNYKARYIAKYGSKYRAVVWYTGGVQSNYHRVNSGSQYYIEGDQIVIACGSVESPALLSRSRTVPLPGGYTRINTSFSATNLGKKIDGTGDFVQGGFLPSSHVVDGYKGAIMMNTIDRGNYILQDLHGIPAGPTVKFEGSFYLNDPNSYYGSNPRQRTWGIAYKQRFKSYGKHMMGVAIIGKSPSGANITVVDDAGNAKISTTAFSPPTNAINEARSIITSLGGTVANTPWENSGTAATVHPVGGCKMGSWSDSVVDPHNLQVWYNPGLYVIDGSVLPGSPFRNPSSTIGAIAEKAMDVILGVPGAPSW
jgi:cholesterol oxidase